MKKTIAVISIFFVIFTSVFAFADGWTTGTTYTSPSNIGAEPTVTAGSSSQYYRGDKTWQTLNQASISGLTTANTPSFTGVTATGGRFMGGKNISVTALNTWTDLGMATATGLYVFRDSTSGGVAVYAADGGKGAVQIINNITGFTMSFTSGSMQIQLTSGSVPRSIYMTTILTTLS